MSLYYMKILKTLIFLFMLMAPSVGQATNAISAAADLLGAHCLTLAAAAKPAPDSTLPYLVAAADSSSLAAAVGCEFAAFGSGEAAAAAAGDLALMQPPPKWAVLSPTVNCSFTEEERGHFNEEPFITIISTLAETSISVAILWNCETYTKMALLDPFPEPEVTLWAVGLKNDLSWQINSLVKTLREAEKRKRQLRGRVLRASVVEYAPFVFMDEDGQRTGIEVQ